MEHRLRITPSVTIPLSEVHFRFSRSGGAGGQNVNKVSTRVELLFDVRRSPSLTQAQKDRVARRLAARLTHDGWVAISSQESRSQWQNREAVVRKFVGLLSGSLKARRRRIAMKPTKASHEKRLRSKAHASRKKEQRRRVFE